jgi:hypothetical protein
MLLAACSHKAPSTLITAKTRMLCNIQTPKTLKPSSMYCHGRLVFFVWFDPPTNWWLHTRIRRYVLTILYQAKESQSNSVVNLWSTQVLTKMCCHERLGCLNGESLLSRWFHVELESKQKNWVVRRWWGQQRDSVWGKQLLAASYDSSWIIPFPPFVASIPLPLVSLTGLELLVEEREGFITATILEQGDTLVVNTSPHLRQKVRSALQLFA